jgi:drug/metabolite transporter (DMT)-like permease
MPDMGAADLLSYLAAAVASFGNALANVMQRKASLEQAEAAFDAKFVARLVRNPTWVLGFTGMVLSFAFQALALSLGELSAVETIITLEVPLTLLVASRVFGGRLTRQEWTAIGLMTVGMIALIGALNPRPGNESGVNGMTYAAAGTATVATIAALVGISRVTRRASMRTVCLGAAAGTCFGLTATLIKETVEQFQNHGVLGLVTTWQTYGAVLTGLTGVLLMQWALHSGPLLAAQPGFTLMDPLVSILWGVLVYNEVTRTGGWLVLACAGGVAIGLGVVSLARSPLFAPDASAQRDLAAADTLEA